jgi:sulfur carrier protein ThiS
MHGAPEAIDDITIEELIRNLKLEHESWIAVYNKRGIQK